MADLTIDSEDVPKKRSILPLLLGVILALLAAGGGYFAVSIGVFAGSTEAESKDEPAKKAGSFLPIEPLLISLGENGTRHLRFQAQLEVAKGRESDVKDVLPRITDVLNGYLRAIEVADIADPAALVRLRAQMLRRVQIIVGEGVVKDLLVMEFVLN